VPPAKRAAKKLASALLGTRTGCKFKSHTLPHQKWRSASTVSWYYCLMDGTAVASIIIGLGATVAAMVFPTKFPAAQRWAINMIWWGGWAMTAAGVGYLSFKHGMPPQLQNLRPAHLITVGSIGAAIFILIAILGLGWQWHEGEVGANKSDRSESEQKEIAALRSAIDSIQKELATKHQEVEKTKRELEAARQQNSSTPAAIPNPLGPPAPANPYPPGPLFQQNYLPDEAELMIRAERT
jgi:hypothetical protein